MQPSFGIPVGTLAVRESGKPSEVPPVGGAAEEARYDVFLCDSLSHFWTGREAFWSSWIWRPSGTRTTPFH
jgi:hypothetical protein